MDEETRVRAPERVRLIPVTFTEDEWKWDDQMKRAQDDIPYATEVEYVRADAVCEDARRWRALMASQYIRVLGSARLGTDDAHIGVEFTARVPECYRSEGHQQHHRNWFIEFVNGLLGLRPLPDARTE